MGRTVANQLTLRIDDRDEARRHLLVCAEANPELFSRVVRKIAAPPREPDSGEGDSQRTRVGRKD